MSREKRGSRRNRSAQVSQLDGRRPITSSFLARIAKSSALSGVPACTAFPGLAWGSAQNPQPFLGCLSWPKGLRLAWQEAPQKGVRIFRFARETGKSTEPVCPGVTPGRSASDHFLVSRATRKILSPFWPSPDVQQPGPAWPWTPPGASRNPQPFLALGQAA